MVQNFSSGGQILGENARGRKVRSNCDLDRRGKSTADLCTVYTLVAIRVSEFFIETMMMTGEDANISTYSPLGYSVFLCILISMPYIVMYTIIQGIIDFDLLRKPHYE